MRSDEAHKDRQLSHNQRHRRRRFPSPRVSLRLPIHLACCLSFRFNLRRFFFSLSARLPARHHIVSLWRFRCFISFVSHFIPFHSIPTATKITLSFCDAQHFSFAQPIKIKTEYILHLFLHHICPHIGRSIAMAQVAADGAGFIAASFPSCVYG